MTWMTSLRIQDHLDCVQNTLITEVTEHLNIFVLEEPEFLQKFYT